jgi:beta-N-acetylhexosaminidase
MATYLIFRQSETMVTNTDTSGAAATIEKIDLPLGKHFMIAHAIGDSVASTTELIRAHSPAGVIIMGDVVDPAFLPVWIEEWQAAADMPLIIGIDQEGGVVSRLKQPGFVQTSQREIDSAEEAYQVGRERGEELAALGINMNFAPVLDSAEDPNSFMFNRVFTPRENAAAYAAAMSRGMADTGVTPVAKHFPGHDDTAADSHFELPVVPIPQDELDEFIAPFTGYIDDYDPVALMTAHVLFPNIDDRPATLSRYFLTDLLRTELGFNGIVITDDISMDAIDTDYGVAEASVLALAAGADIILLASEPERIGEILKAVSETKATNPEIERVITTSGIRLNNFLNSSVRR